MYNIHQEEVDKFTRNKLIKNEYIPSNFTEWNVVEFHIMLLLVLS